MYRWKRYDSVWSNLVRYVLVEDGNPYAYFAIVDRLRGGMGWNVVKPNLPHLVLDTLGEAEREAERAAGIDPSEVRR